MIMFTLVFASATFAQTANTVTTPPINPEKEAVKKAQMNELCNDIRAYHNKRVEAKLAFIKRDFASAKADFADAKLTKQAIKKNAEILKTEGVENPTRLAHEEVKKIIERNIEADVKAIMIDKKAEKAALKNGNTNIADAERIAIATDKKELRKDIKESKRNSGWHLVIIRANHIFHI